MAGSTRVVDVIEKIKRDIPAERIGNEQSVRQGAVQHMLLVLGWPVFDTGVVNPECPTADKDRISS